MPKIPQLLARYHFYAPLSSLCAEPSYWCPYGVFVGREWSMYGRFHPKHNSVEVIKHHSE